MADIKIIVDDFRISHVFDIEEPIPERDLSQALQNHGYKIISDRVINHPPIRAVILNMATKNNVNVTYQKESIPSYIGVTGKDKREVLNQFDILNNILIQLDPTINGRQTSTEMLMAAKVFGKSIPTETLANTATSDASKFNKVFGVPMKTSTISYSHADKTSEAYTSVTFAPLYRSPRYYWVQLVHRNKDLTNVTKFANNGEQFIKEAISILE